MKNIILTFILAIAAYAENTTARVIYSEASPICSPAERFLVASVIKNRIGHEGFGRLGTMAQVAGAKGQFSCVNDAKNSNWQASGGTLYDKAWRQSVALSDGGFTPYPGIVYYHDKSIDKPKSWDNKYWRSVKVIETAHFIFYRVEKR